VKFSQQIENKGGSFGSYSSLKGAICLWCVRHVWRPVDVHRWSVFWSPTRCAPNITAPTPFWISRCGR